MKQKQKNIHKKKMIVSILLATVIVSTGTCGTIFALHGNSSNDHALTKPRDNKAVESMFSFSDPQNWWQGVTTKNTMVVFDDNKAHACFVMLEYAPGKVDVDSEINKINSVLIKDSYILTPLESVQLTMQVNNRPLPYELRQSSVVSPAGSSKVKGGQAFAYIQLTDGYVKIAGYCDTPEQLPNIPVALEAIKFDDTK